MATFFIDNHGCAKNQTDGELLCGYLEKAGFAYTENADLADFIIINSCGFIQSAKKESIDAVYSVKANYPRAKIILAGCLAQRYAQVLSESMPELDGIFGNGDLSKITQYMKSIQTCGNSPLKPAIYPQKGICEGDRPRIFNYKGSAFVKITEGCSNNCSFCAIPLIRGPVRSRPVKNIVREIKELLADGIYEINLIGQDLAAFTTEEEHKGSALLYLLQQLSALQGNFIIRTLYIHPDHFNTDILEVYQKDKRILPYFDIPFQSGDDNIIKAMNRTGTAAGYLELVKTIRSKLPQAVLRTTFLTGFPGETEEAAQNTMEFLKALNPNWSGCFAYSREEDTPAYTFKNRVPARLAAKRAEALQELQSRLTASHNQKYTGQELDVLIEEIIESEDEGLAIARAWFQAPEVDGNVVVRYDLDSTEQCALIAPGKVVKVKILSSTGLDLDSVLLH